jgi:hypothetical protein
MRAVTRKTTVAARTRSLIYDPVSWQIGFPGKRPSHCIGDRAQEIFGPLFSSIFFKAS